ncbi:hypothetical protein GKC56_03375 [Neisseriaceae bacterium PsAf]|nr:hypothetical protein [Neisseriaceae bacterium PsAf]MCV2502990.1 hypothetical protein [Neisseriaceae bacterium]
MSRDDFNNNDDYLNPDVEKKYPLDADEVDNQFQEEIKPSSEEIELTRAEKRELKKAEKEQQKRLEEEAREQRRLEREQQRQLEEQERVRQQAMLEEERRIEKLEKKEAKEQKRLEKRERPVPVYKWIFVMILLLIPIINIFFVIYWGFFSDRVNKNIRSYVLALLILFIIIGALIIVGYVKSDQLDPLLLQALTNFFDGIYDLSSKLFNQLGQLLSQVKLW